MSGSLPLAFHASLPHGLVSSEERLMTAGSGQRLSVLLPQSSPLGRCLKILLESETWGSVEFSLRWKLKATKCGCSVFQLAPSMRRTEGNDSGLFAGESESAWPTPAARDIKGQIQNPERMDYVPNILKATWSTPCLADKEMGQNRTDKPVKDGLRLASAAKAAWATPDTNPMAPNSSTNRGKNHGGARPRLTQQGLGPQATGATTSGCLARTEKFAVRLTTLSAWLMGYTAQYLAHWETASSRRSRKSSSKP